MLYDPFKTWKAGSVAAELHAAQLALERAGVDAISLVPDSDWRQGIVGAITKAQDAVKAARALDLWEPCRPEAVASKEQR